LTTSSEVGYYEGDEDLGNPYLQQGDNGDDDGDDAFEEEMTTDEYEELSYLSVNTDGLTVPTLVVPPGLHQQQQQLMSWHRFNALSLTNYVTVGVADLDGGDPWASNWIQWPIWGVDHPGYQLSQLTTYAVPRWGRSLTEWEGPSDETRPTRSHRPTGTTVAAPGVTAHLYQTLAPRGGDLLYSTGVDALFEELSLTGWAVFDTGVDPHDFADDDDEGVEFGGTGYGWGYRWVTPGGYLRAGYRPEPVTPVWGASTGVNGWRYLVGETVTAAPAVVVDHERVWLEWASHNYVDNYGPDDLFFQDEAFIREAEDLVEDFTDEDADEEVGRTLDTQFPTPLLAMALAGASPGQPQYGPGLSRLSGLLGRADNLTQDTPLNRSELRSYYRRYRRVQKKSYRRLRRGQLRRRLGRPWGVVSTAYGMLQQQLDLVGSENVVTPEPEHTTAVGPAHAPELARDQGFDLDENSLRLWALTEVYLGDYPTGAAVDC